MEEEKLSKLEGKFSQDALVTIDKQINNESNSMTSEKLVQDLINFPYGKVEPEVIVQMTREKVRELVVQCGVDPREMGL